MKRTSFKRIILTALCVCMLATSLAGCKDVAEEAIDSTVGNTADSTVAESVKSDTEASTDEAETERPYNPNWDKPRDPTPEIERPWVLKYNNGISIRDLTIDVGLEGEEVTVIHLTDLHLGDCTEEDLKNPTLASTYEKRQSSYVLDSRYITTKKVLDYVDTLDFDQIVLTGDTLDYLSQGSLNLMDELFWDRYREADGSVQKVMAALGNHEHCQQMTGTVAETLSLEERYAMLQENWEHDIYYSSKVIKDKVMLIQMNDMNGYGLGQFFWEGQAELLSADIALARENGYTVLMFMHGALATGDPKDIVVNSLTNFGVHQTVNFFTASGGACVPDNDVDRAVYDVITNNADVISGIFCGHHHGDYYTEINAKTADGSEKPIPQYNIPESGFSGGCMLKITVK